VAGRVNESPLRVLYLIDSLASGGAQRQLVTLVRSLDRAVIEPTVAVYHPLYHFRPELAEAGVQLVDLGPGRGRSPRVLWRLISLLRRGNFDLVHSWLRTPGVLASVAATAVGGPRVIVSERNTDPVQAHWSVLLQRALAGRADRMVVNADAIAERVERLIPAWRGRIRVVPNGLEWTDPSSSDEKAAEDFRGEHLGGADLLLGVVGRIGRQKAPHVLLDALTRLPGDTAARLSVVWVGKQIDRGLADSVRTRVSELPGTTKFTLVPETRQIRGVYLALDGLILPSRWEGLPNAVLEALAHGVPVVATDVGDTSKLVRDGDNGWLVAPDDADALAAAIDRLVRADDLGRRAMGARGAEFVRREFSSALLVERTVAVYRELLDSPSACAPYSQDGSGGT
jgi:glycosyltransferase involved in cell wall biosynthesis